MGLDELAHELEVEAEVIRAISYLTPKQASEFLFKLALKIRRSCEVPDELPELPFVGNGQAPEPKLLESKPETPPKTPAPVWYEPPPPASSSPEVDPPPPLASLVAPPTNPTLSTQPNRTQTIVNVIKVQGPVSREDLYKTIAQLFQETYPVSKSRTASLLWQLMCKDRILENEEGLLVVPPGEMGNLSGG